MGKFTVLVMFLTTLLTIPTAGAAETAVRATIDSDGVQRLEVIGGGYFFKPRHLIVKVNQPVELKVRKEPGWVPHNIVMNSPEAGLVFDVTLSEEPVLLKFTASKTGTFPIYCSKKLLFFASHREKGMEGQIEVVE